MQELHLEKITRKGFQNMVLQHTLKIVILFGQLQTVITFLIFLAHANIGIFLQDTPIFRNQMNLKNQRKLSLVSIHTISIIVSTLIRRYETKQSVLSSQIYQKKRIIWKNWSPSYMNHQCLILIQNSIEHQENRNI